MDSGWNKDLKVNLNCKRGLIGFEKNVIKLLGFKFARVKSG